MRFPTLCPANWAPRLSDSACFEIVDVIFWKQSDYWQKIAPGSAAAPDKWFLQKSRISEKTVLPQAAQLPRTRGFFKKCWISGKKVLPRTSGSVAKKRPTAAAKGAERLLAGPGGGAPWNAGGCATAPRLPPPKFEPKFIFQIPIHRPGGRYVNPPFWRTGFAEPCAWSRNAQFQSVGSPESLPSSTCIRVRRT